MKIRLFVLVALAMSFAIAGPVSYYGKLTAKDGYLYGANTGTTLVQVKGMSMFWDTWDVGYNFYKASVVDSLVSQWKVEILRVAHGTGNNLNSSWQSLDDAVIQEAINKDIYVIIDYHSHTANNEVSEATTFFTYMAQKWGSYANVIFEVFNEPSSSNMWSSVKSYANTIIPVIRKYSSNLIIVGNSEYSAHPEEAISDPVTDSGNNTAYTFHFYANTHYLDGGDYDGYVTFRNRIRNAIQAGRTVFVTEWGTTDSDGDGTVNTSSSDAWLTFLDNNHISWCNWSVSDKSEASAAFMGQTAYTNPTNWTTSGYSTSGTYVYNKLQTWATSAAWRTGASSSSSAAVSSSSQAAGTTDYIDDFEDGDKYAFTGGIWYAYTDKGDSGSSSITNAADNEGGYVVVQSAGSGNSSKYMAGMNGIVLSQGKNAYDPYVALGIKLNADESDYDLSKCSTISYKYKGAAHNFKAQMSTITNYNYHSTNFVAKSDWTSVTVSWDDLTQADWGDTDTHVSIDKTKVNKFAWEIKESAGTQPDYNYLWIDDVKCNGIGITPVASPSSSSTASSSSAKSSSSIASSSSAKSSSSVTSSSSAKSSSSVASSSSVTVSSSSTAKSSSSATAASSSATVITPTGTWASDNTTLSNNTATGVNIGTSSDYNSDRIVTYTFTTTAGMAYTVTFSAALTSEGSIAMTTSVGNLCSTNTTLTSTAQTVTCKFTATSATSMLSLTIAGGSWQTVAISGLSITEEGGTTTIADNTRANVLPLRALHNGIEFTVSADCLVKLQVFDMLGHTVRSHTESMSAGTHGMNFGKLTQGNYIVRVQAQGKSAVTRMQVR